MAKVEIDDIPASSRTEIFLIVTPPKITPPSGEPDCEARRIPAGMSQLTVISCSSV
jgi:hypothetical protein